MRRSIVFTLIVGFVSFAGVVAAEAQKRAEAKDFTVQFFLERQGEFSPNIFTIQELVVHNGSYQGKEGEGGKFSGFLVRVELHADGETFAQGRQAQITFRDRKTKKVLKTWNISDVYIGDSGKGFRARFFEDLDCNLMEVTLTSGTTRITRDLAFNCGE